MGPISRDRSPSINSIGFSSPIKHKFDKIDAIVFDIDGTILTSQNQIQKGLEKYFEILSYKKINVLLASARPLTSILNIGKLLKVSLPVIGLNGSIIADEMKIIFSQSFDPSRIIEMFNEFKDISISYYFDYDWFVDKVDDNIKKESDLVSMEPIILHKKLEKVQKILLIGNRLTLEQIKIKLSLFNEVEAHFSKADYLEINPKGVNKLNSINKCLSYIYTPGSSVMAIGDGENDLPMLSEFNLGIAMGNAPEIVKKAASFVIKSNDEYGLVEFLNYFCRIRGF